MKSKKLMIAALCLATTVAKAQVVYGDDEKECKAQAEASNSSHLFRMATTASDFRALETIGLPLFRQEFLPSLVRLRGAVTSMTRLSTQWCSVLVSGILASLAPE